jgi:ribosomal protein L12E/L44/L45/RPP1/RPP2
MLAPPTSSGYRAADPTKLKARKFASGPRAATEGKPAGISSIWTETPEEKARRLANAVLGREDPNAAGASAPQTTGGPSRPDGSSSSKADEARVRSYIEQTRGKSLLEEHQAARAAGKASSAGPAGAAVGKGDKTKWGGVGADDEEDDPSKRAFDWEKDMKVGGRISGAQRKELLNRAANFGGRFQSGKYL